MSDSDGDEMLTSDLLSTKDSQVFDDLWHLAQQVFMYAVDQSSFYPIFLRDSRVGAITEDDFLSELYAPRLQQEFETRLVKHMLHASSLVVLVASRGSGKTSALRYALKQLRSMSLPILPLLIDVKKMFDQYQFIGLAEHNAAGTFRDTVRREVMSATFSDITEVRRLIAWLLAGPPDSSDNFDPSHLRDLYDVSLRQLSELGNDRAARSERVLQLIHYYTTHSHQFTATLQEVLPLVRLAHLCQAAVKLQGHLERVLLVFDNVDRIPGEFQHSFFRFLNDSQLAAGSLCTIIVAIRPESVRRSAPATGERADLLQLILPEPPSFPGVIVPRGSSEHVTSILDRRLRLATRLIATVSPETSVASVASPFLLLHGQIVGSFAENSIHALANGDLRSIVLLYVQFSRYLGAVQRTEPGAATATVAGRNRAHLETLLFLFLREVGESLGLGLHHLDDVGNMPPPTGRYADYASLGYHLLACTLNASPPSRLEEVPVELPTFGEIVGRLRRLGWPLHSIRASFHELWSAVGDAGALVEPYQGDIDPSSLDETSEVRIRLTPKGRELLVNVQPKMGYCWGLAAASEATSGRRIVRGYLELTQRERSNVMLLFLRRAVERRMRLLGLVVADWRSLFGDDWLSKFRREFGVNGKLPEERMLNSAAKFFRGLPDAERFHSLGRAFGGLLEHLSAGAATEDLRFFELDRALESMDES